MGQYANQPDFGTEAKEILANNAITPTTNLGGAVIYIGDTTGGSDIKVILRGVTGPTGGFPTATEPVTFKNVQAGSFLPVIVDYVLLTGTTATSLIAIK